MNKEEYVNKEEYNNLVGVNSYEEPNPEEEGDNDHFRNPEYEEELMRGKYADQQQDYEAEGEEYEGEEEEIKHAGLQTMFLEDENKHALVYVLEGFEPEHAVVEVDDQQVLVSGYQGYGSSPIQENEDEQYSTPNNDQVYIDRELDERLQLFQLANEVKKKDQGKKFVLWETNEMRNKWDDKLYSNKRKAVWQKLLEHHWNNDIERARNSPSSRAKAFDYSNIEEQNKPVHKSKRWQEFNESKVPMLSDYDAVKQRKVGKRVELGDPLHYVPKKDHTINNVFLQSELQNQLQGSKNVKTNLPNTHQSIKNRVDPKKEMFAGRPLFNNIQSSGHVQNVNAGRNRNFYSSHIF